MRSKFAWTLAALSITFFLFLMLLIVIPVRADEWVIPYLSVEPDWPIRYYFDGRTVKM